jgi:integrase
MTTLRQAVQEYLSMRRALGFKLQEAGKGLLDFVTFMEKRRASYITSTLALEWAQQPQNVQPAYWAGRLSYVRVFARHRSATDPRTQIPPPGLLPFQPKRARPYLYSDDEIERLMRAALRMPCRFERGQLRPWVYYCLFGLLSVSGLRLGEARNLELQDADLKTGVLTVRGAKFGNALWLGHERVETTSMYLQADMQLKEQALARTTATRARTSRYRPSDRVLAFLNTL